MFLVVFNGKLDSLFFDKIDAEQYMANFPKDLPYFELIELDEHRSDVIASIAIDVYDNYRFCKATGLVE